MRIIVTKAAGIGTGGELPEIDREKIYKLLDFWGVPKDVLENLTIAIVVVPERGLAWYDKRGNNHVVYLAEANFFEISHNSETNLNTYLIHELRHMYWNIIKNGNAGPNSPDYEFEQENCVRMEEVFKRWKLLYFASLRKEIRTPDYSQLSFEFLPIVS